MKKLLGLVSLPVLLIPLGAGAFDYKDWAPLLPKTLGNMAPSGNPDGMNMDMGGQMMSSLEQRYASPDGSKTAQLSIVAGPMAPQAQGLQEMENLNMETDDQLVKTVTIEGKRCMLNLDKQNKSGNLMIGVQQQMAIMLSIDPANSEAELMSIAKQLPIAAFAKLKP